MNNTKISFISAAVNTANMSFSPTLNMVYQPNAC